MNKNGLIYTILFSFVVTFVLVIPLSLANEATKPQVEVNKRLESGRAILTSLGLDVGTLDEATILAQFNSLDRFRVENEKLIPVPPAEVEQREKTEVLFYKLTLDGQPRWASNFTGPGLWGSITVAIGFPETLDTIAGFKVVSQAETPGLGGRIDEPWFAQQFIGQSISGTPLTLNAIGTGSGDPNKNDSAFDGVTGATLTSVGIRDIVNNAVTTVQTILKGGQ